MKAFCLTVFLLSMFSIGMVEILGRIFISDKETKCGVQLAFTGVQLAFTIVGSAVFLVFLGTYIYAFLEKIV
jgi:hypothetical protein